MNTGQREALLRAMLDELVSKGYSEVSVEAAMRSAGVSRAEFVSDFHDKDDCLFAAYDSLADRLVARTSERCDSVDSWPDRVREGLAALLDQLADDPAMARALTRAFPGIRPDTYERYVSLLGRFASLMTEGRDYSEVEEELPREVELLAVGAAEAIIFGEVDAGRADQLPAMLPEILFSVLVPFVGPERAADEMRSAAATG
jgi:AcrR family transcriptional regulator